MISAQALMVNKRLYREPTSSRLPENTLVLKRNPSYLPIQNAINAGLFSPGVGVGFDCSSGNCTFPDSYNSLAYCSHSDDISDTLSFTQVCYNINGDPSEAIDCQANLSMNVTSTLPSRLSVTVSGSGGSPDISTMQCTSGGVNSLWPS